MEVKAQENPDEKKADFLFQKPRKYLGLRIGAFFPDTDSGIFDMITDENSGYFMDQLLKNNVPFNGPLFAEMLGNDRNKLAKLMNDLYGIALPVGVATGAGAMLANPYTDQSPIGEYKNGGQYGLGDEVDEATMKQLKKLGFTFEKIK